MRLRSQTHMEVSVAKFTKAEVDELKELAWRLSHILKDRQLESEVWCDYLDGVIRLIASYAEEDQE